MNTTCFEKKLDEVRRKIRLTFGDDDVSSLNPIRRSTSSVFSDEGSSDDQVSIQERNNVERGGVGKVRERIPFVVYV